MSMLFNDLPSGCHHYAGYLNARDQAICVNACRQLLSTHPLMQPRTKSGEKMALQVSSWGVAGWFGERGEYHYIRKHGNGKIWPEIPRVITNFMNEVLIISGFGRMEFETVLLNWYPPGTGHLGMHRDVTEFDQESPIVTISLGDDAVFALGGLEYGGKKRRLTLRSGDVFVMGGESRLLYHEIEKLIPAENPLFKDGGRISLTGRRIWRCTDGMSDRDLR